MYQISGRTDAGVVWWTRQLTGKPHIFRGYVEVDGRKMPCGHDHRKSRTATKCARDLALVIGTQSAERSEETT